MTGQAAKSAKRAFDIYELFSDSAESLSVSHVARALDYPASSTSVLLKELCRAGYLIQDPQTRHYRLSPRMALASARIFASRPFERRVVEMVDSIHAETGEEVMLAVQCGVEVQYVHLRRATLPFPSQHRPGSMRPICRTSVGKILLANKREDEIGRLVRRINAFAETPQVALPALMAELRKARDSQLAAAFEEATPGAAGLAVSLPVPAGQPAVALAICGMPERIRQRRDLLTAILRRCRETARAVSR